MYGYDNDLRSQLIKTNVEYYGPRLTELDSGEKKTTWNWFAFLVPFCWLAYRKLYLECAVYYIVTNGLNTGITQILANLGVAVNIGWTIDVLAMFFCGLYGNTLYKNRLDKLVVKCVELPEEEREKFIRRHGGTSVVAIIVAFCITISIAILLYLLRTKVM